MAILATLAGVNIFAAFKLGTNGRLKFSSTATAGAVLLAWMLYVSIVSGVGALAVIGMVVGCAQIVIAVVAGKKGADSSESQEDIQAKLPLLAARCVALGIGLGILSLLPGHNIDSFRAIWLLGLAVVLLAITRIAEMGNKAGSWFRRSMGQKRQRRKRCRDECRQNNYLKFFASKSSCLPDSISRLIVSATGRSLGKS